MEIPCTVDSDDNESELEELNTIVIESLGLVTSLANIFNCFVLKRLV